MEKKTIFIALGLLAVAGIGIYVWKSKSKDKDKDKTKESSSPSAKKLDVKAVIPKLDVKIPSGQVAEKKSGVIREPAKMVEVKVTPVTMIPDRRWLEKNWADVS